MALEAEVEKLVEDFLADFDAVRFNGYRRFFVEGPQLTLIIPRVGLIRGLDAYLEYESRSTKLSERRSLWEDRSVEFFGNVARVMGSIKMSYSDGQERREIREFITFLLERRENGWKCFHLQATLNV
jgi:ketosteroid isomerase-like protein